MNDVQAANELMVIANEMQDQLKAVKEKYVGKDLQEATKKDLVMMAKYPEIIEALAMGASALASKQERVME